MNEIELLNILEAGPLDLVGELGWTLPPVREVNRAGLFVLAAEAFQHPMSEVKVLQQVGRFLLVAYTPISQTDPAIVLCYDGCLDALAFNRASAAYVESLAVPFPDRRSLDLGAWYKRGREFIKSLLPPLYKLNPHPEEARFALLMSMGLLASGQMSAPLFSRSEDDRPVRWTVGAREWRPFSPEGYR